MADLARATYQAEKRKPPLSPVWQAPNLLVALVVATAPPPGKSTFDTVDHPSHRLSANADTSRGTPKGLTEDAYMAAAMPETAAPQRRPSLPANTSFRNAALLAPTVAPQPQAPWAEAKRLRNGPADTSSGTPLVLRAPVVLAPVFGKSTDLAPGRRGLLFDTSAETPKPLTLDATRPVENRPWPVLDRRRPGADTSSGSSLGLREFVPPSVVPPAPFVVAIRKPWLPADTSRGTPKGLTLDATKPFFVAPTLLAHPKKPVWDTSKGLDLPLVTTIPLPPPPGKSTWNTAFDFRRAFWLPARAEHLSDIPAPAALLKPVGDPFMAARVQVSAKLPSEVRVEQIDLSPFLEIGQNANSAAGAIGVYSGVDPDYLTVLGSISVGGTTLEVQLRNGVQGVIYIITIYVSATSPTETIPVSFFLAIAPELP